MIHGYWMNPFTLLFNNFNNFGWSTWSSRLPTARWSTRLPTTWWSTRLPTARWSSRLPTARITSTESGRSHTSKSKNTNEYLKWLINKHQSEFNSLHISIYSHFEFPFTWFPFDLNPQKKKIFSSNEKPKNDTCSVIFTFMADVVLSTMCKTDWCCFSGKRSLLYDQNYQLNFIWMRKAFD